MPADLPATEMMTLLVKYVAGILPAKALRRQRPVERQLVTGRKMTSSEYLVSSISNSP